MSEVQDKPAIRKVAVWFTHKREATADQLYSGRFFISGVADIRTEEGLLGLEGVMLARLKEKTPDAHSVIITNWKSLEG